jgi:predicted Zn-ribbon and HTH transcriptional regulator
VEGCLPGANRYGQVHRSIVSVAVVAKVMSNTRTMGFLDRVLGRNARPTAANGRPGIAGATVLPGRETLEVVGESHYQENLWALAGGHSVDRIRCAVTAVLVPEPENEHDSNAVKVLIEGRLVGHLSREDAVAYLPGLQRLTATHESPIALMGQIVGGGPREDGLGMLGVFLDHNPADFGLRPSQITYIGELRTGLSQAVATDLEDDSYDLSWYEPLSGNQAPGDIVALRRLLAAENDLIDRHFMLAELGKCLYKSRDAFSSALDEFDAVCVQHDAEMGRIRSALYQKFGCVPIIEMYRQAAIRCQKAHDWQQMRLWAERGLAVYGSEAARPEAVADLDKRLAYADAKMAAASAPRPARRMARRVGLGSTTAEAAMETLVCSECGAEFQRVRSRGRKPLRCPSCRGASEEPTGGE